MFGDGLGASPFYAVSTNLSERGMHFKSQFELLQGAQVFIGIEGYTMSLKQVPARVVWCDRLNDSKCFTFSIGLEFLNPLKDVSMKDSPLVEMQTISPSSTKESRDWS